MKTSVQFKTVARLCGLALLTTAAAGSALAQTAPADVTRGAVAVTTTMGQFSSTYNVSQLIDQSGLSLPYVSGITVFDTFVTSAVHNSSSAGNLWASNSIRTGFLSFDLGAAYNIDGLAWFGLATGSPARVSGIKVYADNDGDATNGNAGLLFDSGTFGTAAGSTNIVKPNVFSFSTSANTRYLDIEIVSNDGYVSAGLGEVVFRQGAAVAAVPEPGTYALMGLGLLAVGCRVGFTQRRRMAQR